MEVEDAINSIGVWRDDDTSWKKRQLEEEDELIMKIVEIDFSS